MAVDEFYSDQERVLYDILGWALSGDINTVNHQRSKKFAGFLDDLYGDDDGYLSGEPDWEIQRLILDGSIEEKYPYVKGSFLVAIRALRELGEKDAFWLESIHSDTRQAIVSSDVFWKVALDAFDEFILENPKKSLEYDVVKKNYPQLLK